MHPLLNACILISICSMTDIVRESHKQQFSTDDIVMVSRGAVAHDGTETLPHLMYVWAHQEHAQAAAF